MEFLRFGSSIPGSYWGCCACCIIQNFKVDPDEKASIQIVEGDGGSVQLFPGEKGAMFAGMTYREIFWSRLRFGTFSTREMPNHAFFAILSKNQLNQTYGKAWLAILKEAGFEFIRSVNNSVWNADNYIFGLIRNVGPNAIKDQFTPPKAWTDLSSVVPEPWAMTQFGVGYTTEADDHEIKTLADYTAEIQEAQKKLWDSQPKAKFYTEAELVEAKVPITLAGVRSEYPQELKSCRDAKLTALEPKEDKPQKADPFTIKLDNPT